MNALRAYLLFDEVSQSCDYWFNVRCPSSRASIGFDHAFQMAADDSPTFSQMIMDRSAALPFVPNSLEISLPSTSGMGDSVNTLLQWVGADSGNTANNMQKGNQHTLKQLLQNSGTRKTYSRLPKRKNASVQKVLLSRQPEPIKDDPSVKSISLPPPKGFLAPNQLGTDWIPLAAFR